MSETRHAATVILAVGADDCLVTIALECDVCGRSALHCAPSHLATLARLLTAAAEREAGFSVGFTLREEA